MRQYLIKCCPVCQHEFRTFVNDDLLKKQGGITCSRACSNTFFKEKRHSLDLNLKLSNKMKGRPATRKKYDRIRIEKFCAICGKYFEVTPSGSMKKTCGNVSCRFKQLSKSLKGKTGGVRPGGGWGKSTTYANIVWDSTWEVRLAKRLDTLGITWIRPNKSLSITYLALDNTTHQYYPDFYLPDFDLFLEVKGYWTQEARHKMQQCQQQKIIIILESLKEIDEFDPFNGPIV
jgi:hypothetical protein